MIETRTVTPDEADIRLDRWFKRHYPALGHVQLEKLLRTGQVRVDGKRATASDRLVTGQAIRLPPQVTSPLAPPERSGPAQVSPRDAAWLQSMLIHQDDDVLAIAKPAGLAVQGGTGTTRHLDGMLDALRLGAEERPRLVHRLDRETSGVLLLARNALAASRLAASFKGKDAQKTYWAVVVGVPHPRRGSIDLPLSKGPAGKVEGDPDDGQTALTRFETVEVAHKRAAWLSLEPETGRTHQLRVHCAAIGCPILGDRKYGGPDAVLPGADLPKQLHLHARRIRLPHPRKGMLEITAELPPHMVQTFGYLGFNQ